MAQMRKQSQFSILNALYLRLDEQSPVKKVILPPEGRNSSKSANSDIIPRKEEVSQSIDKTDPKQTYCKDDKEDEMKKSRKNN